MTKLTVVDQPTYSETQKMGVEERPEDPAVGKWYWHMTEPSYDEDEETRAAGAKKELWCITHIGSNFAEITHAFGGSTRIHLDKFADACEYEPDAENVLKRKVAQQQLKLNGLMEQVRDLTALLGVSGQALPEGETQALAIRGNEIDGYKTSLIKAKDQDLPALFKRIETESKYLGRWMKASMIPLQAEATKLRESIGRIENRLFNVELYTGLVETVEQISDGKAAPMGEQIRLMQRRHYMDEESLVDYTAGGMDFTSVDKFHRWLAKPKNRNRILPFPRCVVAFRIRRKDKEREPGFTVRDCIRIIESQEADKLTFLYLRNGEQLYCLETEIDFEEELFPDLDQRQLGGKLWAYEFAGTFSKLVTDAQYQGMKEDEKRIEAENRKLKKEIERLEKKYGKKPTDEQAKEIRELQRQIKWVHFELDRYTPFTPDTVYYDDILDLVKRQIDKHNRLVLVLQGLLDRSPVFHPHPPWKIWTPEGFNEALDLKYDKTNALVPGEKPDFEAYRAKCNAQISVGTIVTGQQDLWEKHEAEKECERIERNWREARHGYRPKRFKPEGNPGPGLLARVVRISGAKYTVSFEWQRERLREQPWGPKGPLPATFTCSADDIFNVEAYQPGDYKQFYADPRTREEYIQWAPLLLVAEDFHAGKRTIESRGVLVEKGRRNDDT